MTKQDLKELWIGELLQVISSGRVGTYEGISKNGKIRIKSDGKIYLASLKNTQHHTAPTDKNQLPLEPIKKYKEEKTFNNTLDLHMEKLSPDLVHANPIQILNYQIKTCETYLKQAIKRRRASVTIIHGKGKGQLKNEVIHLLKSFSEVKFYIEKNNGGAQEVLFQYI